MIYYTAIEPGWTLDCVSVWTDLRFNIKYGILYITGDIICVQGVWHISVWQGLRFNMVFCTLQGILYVYNVSDRESFNTVKEYIQQTQEVILKIVY